MFEKVFSALAILKVNWDENQDYIENFVPFVTECIKQSESPHISISILQNQVKEEFGFFVPQNALKTILSRVQKRGLIKNDIGVYVRDDAKISEYSIRPLREDSLRKFEALTKKIGEFSKSHHGVEMSIDQIESALLSFLERHSSPVLRSIVEGSPLSLPGFPPEKTDYLIGSFIEHAISSDPDGFDYIETLVKGEMILNVLSMPEIGSAARKFDKTTVYLDTNGSQQDRVGDLTRDVA